MRGIPITTFDNEFDLINRNISEIEIKETNDKQKCLVWDLKNYTKCYNSFLLSKNTKSKIVCDIIFYKSSATNKYLPRPTFKRVSLDGNIQNTRSKEKVTISFNNSDGATVFWKLISFIKKYKDLVDVKDLDSSYKVIEKNSYFIEFDGKTEKEKAEDILKLVKKSSLDSNAIRSIAYETRKKDLQMFYYLLKNKEFKNGIKSHDRYREKYKITPGQEAIWHHFLENRDWILGLNIDIVFIRNFLDEQSVGSPSSQGGGNPKVDMLGVSEYTTLVELKHAQTDIFKKKLSKGRANTWDFTADFVEGISQCLGQINELNKHFENKQYIDSDGVILDKRFIQNIDPKSIFIVGCRNREFPIYNAIAENSVKFQTFHRFRRGNRTVDVITFDELFERAYYTVYDAKLPHDWWTLVENDLFK